jgi:hypothetical protein
MSYRSLLTLGVLLSTSIAVFAASDPYDGGWKIDDSKSSWSDGKFPPNMSLTIDLKIDGNTMKYHSVNDTRKDRPGTVSHFEVEMDGKPHPFPDNERFNQVQIRRIGPGQFEVLEMKDGDVIVGAWWWLSADGQHFVRRGIGKGPDGKSKEYEEYFDKQP